MGMDRSTEREAAWWSLDCTHKVKEAEAVSLASYKAPHACRCGMQSVQRSCFVACWAVGPHGSPIGKEGTLPATWHSPKAVSLCPQNVRSIEEAMRGAEASEDTDADPRERRERGSSPLHQPQATLLTHLVSFAAAQDV